MYFSYNINNIILIIWCEPSVDCFIDNKKQDRLISFEKINENKYKEDSNRSSIVITDDREEQKYLENRI